MKKIFTFVSSLAFLLLFFSLLFGCSTPQLPLNQKPPKQEKIKEYIIEWAVDSSLNLSDQERRSLNIPKRVYMKHGEKLTEKQVPVLQLENYIFLGWFINIKYENKQKIEVGHEVTQSMKIIAMFEPITYKLFYETDYGVAPEPKTIKSGNFKFTYNIGEYNVLLPDTDSHVFKGWYYEGTPILDVPLFDVKSDITIKAKWKINQYTVEFADKNIYPKYYPDYYSKIVDHGTVITKEELKLGTVVKEYGYKYKLSGWKDSITGEVFKSDITVTTNLKLQGVWDCEKIVEPTPLYIKLSYESPTNSNNVKVNDAIKIVSNPPDATIYYAIDSKSDSSFKLYKEPIVVNKNMCIYVRAEKEGYVNSSNQFNFTVYHHTYTYANKEVKTTQENQKVYFDNLYWPPLDNNMVCVGYTVNDKEVKEDYVIIDKDNIVLNRITGPKPIIKSIDFISSKFELYDSTISNRINILFTNLDSLLKMSNKTIKLYFTFKDSGKRLEDEIVFSDFSSCIKTIYNDYLISTDFTINVNPEDFLTQGRQIITHVQIGGYYSDVTNVTEVQRKPLIVSTPTLDKKELLCNGINEKIVNLTFTATNLDVLPYKQLSFSWIKTEGGEETIHKSQSVRFTQEVTNNRSTVTVPIYVPEESGIFKLKFNPDYKSIDGYVNSITPSISIYFQPAINSIDFPNVGTKYNKDLKITVEGKCFIESLFPTKNYVITCTPENVPTDDSHIQQIKNIQVVNDRLLILYIEPPKQQGSYIISFSDDRFTQRRKILITTTPECKTGDIVLKDKTIIPVEKYTQELKNQVDGVMLLDRYMNPHIYSLVQDSGLYQYIDSPVAIISEMIAYPSTNNLLTADFTGDTDGRDNLYLADKKSRFFHAYPIYEQISKTYNNNTKEPYYLPSLMELSDLYRNLDTINSSLEKIKSEKIKLNIKYWSSSEVSEENVRNRAYSALFNESSGTIVTDSRETKNNIIMFKKY